MQFSATSFPSVAILCHSVSRGRCSFKCSSSGLLTCDLFCTICILSQHSAKNGVFPYTLSNYSALSMAVLRVPFLRHTHHRARKPSHCIDMCRRLAFQFFFPFQISNKRSNCLIVTNPFSRQGQRVFLLGMNVLKSTVHPDLHLPLKYYVRLHYTVSTLTILTCRYTCAVPRYCTSQVSMSLVQTCLNHVIHRVTRIHRTKIFRVSRLLFYVSLKKILSK